MASIHHPSRTLSVARIESSLWQVRCVLYSHHSTSSYGCSRDLPGVVLAQKWPGEFPKVFISPDPRAMPSAPHGDIPNATKEMDVWMYHRTKAIQQSIISLWPCRVGALTGVIGKENTKAPQKTQGTCVPQQRLFQDSGSSTSDRQNLQIIINQTKLFKGSHPRALWPLLKQTFQKHLWT